jgi:hypothetical protein
MPRRDDHAKQEGALGRVTSAVKRLLGRGRSESEKSAVEAASPAAQAANSSTARQARPKQEGPKARPAKREADIPLDVLDRSYSPNLTSSKASFRSDGADHQRDQEFAFTSDNERWNDEDHYTNKSGDPRIGTRRRTYEPGEENRAESRD